MARPGTAVELADQLRQLLPHDAQCRWSTHPRRRPDQTLDQTEAAVCTCTAVPDRRHLVDLLHAAASGGLAPELQQQLAGARS